MNLAPIRNIDIQPVRSQATEILQQILENNARKEEMAFRKTEQDARLSELNRKAMAEKRLQEALNVPTTREQTVQDTNAFNFLAREGADPSQFTTSERVPVPESDRMKQQIKNLVSVGDIQGAKQLQDIYEKQKDDQEAGVTYQYYLKNPSGWKQDMIRDFPDRADDINKTSFTPDGRTLIYNDKERGGFWSRDVRTGKEEFKAYPKEDKPKEVNVANEIDTILGGMFPGYYTDANVRQKALAYYATPEGSADIQRRAASYAKSKTADVYFPVPTSSGIEPFKSRGDGAGTFKPDDKDGGKKYKPAPAGEIDKIAALSSLEASAAEAKKLFKPSYVGPVMGRVGSVKEQFVNLPTEQVKFYSWVNDAKDALLRARSGAQINEQEYARLVKFLPTSELPPKNFKARMERYLEQMAILKKEKIRTLESQGYSVELGNAPKSNREKFDYEIPDGISKYKVGNKVYNIPKDKVADFFKDNPNAVMVK
jgi:hypothetical protein